MSNDDSTVFTVAVYGSLRRGLGNHRLLAYSEFLGRDSISGFRMYSLGAFPFIVEDYHSDVEVSVELYNVSSTTMSRLDMLEGYPNFYNRQKVITNGDGVVAWVYFLEDAREGTEEVTTGDWLEYLRAQEREEVSQV